MLPPGQCSGWPQSPGQSCRQGVLISSAPRGLIASPAGPRPLRRVHQRFAGRSWSGKRRRHFEPMFKKGNKSVGSLPQASPMIWSTRSPRNRDLTSISFSASAVVRAHNLGWDRASPTHAAIRQNTRRPARNTLGSVFRLRPTLRTRLVACLYCLALDHSVSSAATGCTRGTASSPPESPRPAYCTRPGSSPKSSLPTCNPPAGTPASSWKRRCPRSRAPPRAWWARHDGFESNPPCGRRRNQNGRHTTGALVALHFEKLTRSFVTFLDHWQLSCKRRG